MAGDRRARRGDHVLFIDADGSVHNALVLVGWPDDTCDLVVVANAVETSRKLDQFSALRHRDDQPMAVFCWCWPDERSVAGGLDRRT